MDKLKDSIASLSNGSLQETFSMLKDSPADAVVASVLKALEDEFKKRNLAIKDPLKQFKK